MSAPMTDIGAVNAILDNLDDAEWAVVDRLGLALEPAGTEGLTPAQAAREARCTIGEAIRYLPVMAAAGYALISGNGADTRYHAHDTPPGDTHEP